MGKHSFIDECGADKNDLDTAVETLYLFDDNVKTFGYHIGGRMKFRFAVVSTEHDKGIVGTGLFQDVRQSLAAVFIDFFGVVEYSGTAVQTAFNDIYAVRHEEF